MAEAAAATVAETAAGSLSSRWRGQFSATNFREVLEPRLLKLRHAPKEKAIRPVLRRFKDDPEAPKERTTMGQRL